jgi:hypothetical protein
MIMGSDLVIFIEDKKSSIQVYFVFSKCRSTLARLLVKLTKEAIVLKILFKQPAQEISFIEMCAL